MGVFHGQNGPQILCFYKCYDICAQNICEKRPLIWKNRFQGLKKYSPNISPHFLDDADGQICDLWLLLLSNSSFFCPNVIAPIALKPKCIPFLKFFFTKPEF